MSGSQSSWSIRGISCARSSSTRARSTRTTSGSCIRLRIAEARRLGLRRRRHRDWRACVCASAHAGAGPAAADASGNGWDRGGGAFGPPAGDRHQSGRWVPPRPSGAGPRVLPVRGCSHPIVKAIRDGLVKRVLIVDLDAHHGDGHAEALRQCVEVKILDFYGADLFPVVVGPIWRGVPFERGSRGTEYLATLRRELPAALNTLSPDLVVYVAGVDGYERDPLTAGYFRLSREQILERDRFVFEQARSASIPIIMVLAGGYGPFAWELQYETVAWVLRRFNDEHPVPGDTPSPAPP